MKIENERGDFPKKKPGYAQNKNVENFRSNAESFQILVCCQLIDSLMVKMFN
jgi:hypothetical protein